MPGLMLHAGANAVSRNDLAALPIPAAMGPRHKIRPFEDDVAMITDFMSTVGLKIKDEAFGVKFNKDNSPTQFFGVMEVAPANVLDGEFIPAEFGTMIGLRGSYDESLPRGLAVGSRVFVCDNLAFSGEVKFQTRQTTNIDKRMPALLRSAVGQIPDLFHAQQARFDRYRCVELKPRWGDAAPIELLRRDVLNVHTIGTAMREWDKPTHPEHMATGRTVWTFHNAITEAIKPPGGRANVLPAWTRTTKLTKFLDEVVDM